MSTHYTFAMEVGRQRREQIAAAVKAGRRNQHDRATDERQHRTWPWNRRSWPTHPTLRPRTA